MPSWDDRAWDDDRWHERDREHAWERADELERAAERLNDRLTRDVGENGARKQDERRKAA
jgi:hypothetical protein